MPVGSLRAIADSPSKDYRVPPMPETLLRAIELMNGADVPEVEDVVAMLEHDPAVVARVLKIANSAYYAQRAEISSVRRAVVVLGPGAVVGLAMSMGMAEMKDAFDQGIMAPFMDIVRHSVATGYIAKAITLEDPSEGNESPEEAYTAGLLHDFGKLVLLYNNADVAAGLYRAEMAPHHLIEEEERVFGTNHTRMGTAVAASLRLPDVLRRVIEHHHSLTSSESHPLIRRVQLSNKLAHALGYPNAPSAVYEDLNQELLEAWRSRSEEVERYVDGIL